MASPLDQLSEYAREKAKPQHEHSPDDLDFELGEDSEDFIEEEDGSVTSFEEGEPEKKDVPFDGNLAEHLERRERLEIGQPLLELIEQDIEDRQPSDKKYAEGIKRSGLGAEGPGGAAFEGASVVTHPILTECAIDFAASAMKEISPPQGPVKTKIMGGMTPDKRLKAERKRDYMNWQLTDQIEEYNIELENLLMQLPFSGSQYLHWFEDESLGRPSVELITSDKVYLPYGASNFYMTERLTIKLEYSEDIVNGKIENGKWVDIESIAPSDFPEKTKTQSASERVEGVDESGYNEDGLKNFFRVFVWREFDFDEVTGGERAPYVLIIDSETGDVASIRRNWEEGDELRLKLDHVVEFKFFPWKGPYGIGFTHMIGGLSAAMTGALRALLDTAHINNFPALLKLKSKTGGQTITMEATGVTEIEGTTPVDDIRKLIMSVPYNPPSETLFKLLGWLDGIAKGVVTTAEEKIADASNNGPVGTTLALIEQGSKVYANIHARLHRSVKKCLLILHRINKDYLDDKVTVTELGDLVVYKTDFEGPLDIIPVSDPHIFSESQRYAQLQAVRQLRTQEPDLFQRKALVRRELQQLRVDNYEELLIPDPQITKANPVAENIMMAKGRPAAAFPEQDHLAHLKVLIEFMQNPNLGASPIIAPKFLPLALQHMSEHIVLWYGTYIYRAMEEVVGPEFEQYLKIDAVSGQIDRALSLLIEEVHGKMDITMQGMPEVIQQATQILQQYQQPRDPATMEVMRKSQRDKSEEEIKKEKLQHESVRTNFKHEVDLKRIEATEGETQEALEEAEIKSSTDIITTRQKNETMKEKATQDNIIMLLIAALKEASSGKGEKNAPAVNFDMSAIVDNIKQQIGSNLDLQPVIDAIKSKPDTDINPIIDAINAKPNVDINPLIDAVKSQPQPDMSPIVEAINKQGVTHNMDMTAIRRYINDLQGGSKMDISPLTQALEKHAKETNQAMHHISHKVGEMSDHVANVVSDVNQKHGEMIEAVRKSKKKKPIKIKLSRDHENKLVGEMKESDEE